jgi:glycosyltransferase involved in cell wall biosynthesis
VKRVLFFTHRNPQGYRIQQYFPFLEARGFEVELCTTQIGFFALLDRMRRSDVVYVQRILFGPLKLSLVRRAAKFLIYDFDDAVMYGSKGESGSRQRKFRNMVIGADAVFAGNRLLCGEAEKYRAEGIHYVPTVVDTAEYPVKKRGKEDDPFTVGWIGSSSTLKYLTAVEDLLLWVANSPRRRVKVIADKPPQIEGDGVIFERWRKDHEKMALLSLDMGIMPLVDDIWSRGKCGLKLIQYMASGLPALAHPVGAAKEIITDGRDGFLEADTDGWRRVIELLSSDGELRAKVGERARQTVEERYSLKVWGPKVAQIMDSL